MIVLAYHFTVSKSGVNDEDECVVAVVYVFVCTSTARSSLLDRSFELCEFRDDPAPLRDKIRSRRMKILLRKSNET